MQIEIVITATCLVVFFILVLYLAAKKTDLETECRRLYEQREVLEQEIQRLMSTRRENVKIVKVEKPIKHISAEIEINTGELDKYSAEIVHERLATRLSRQMLQYNLIRVEREVSEIYGVSRFRATINIVDEKEQ